MYGNKACSEGKGKQEEEVGQVESADSYVLYSEGRAGGCMYVWDGIGCAVCAVDGSTCLHGLPCFWL